MRRMLLFAMCLVTPGESYARAFTVEDYLSIASYGQVMIAREAGVLLVERRRPYGEAPDFAYDNYSNQRILSRILSMPLETGRNLEPLFPQSPDAGYWLAAISPGGSSVAVFRLAHRKLSLGVVDLRRRSVQWLSATPDWPGAAPSPTWVDETHILVVTMVDAGLPVSLSNGSASTDLLAELWSRQSAGHSSETVVSTQDGGPGGARRLVEMDLSSGTGRSLFEGRIVDISLAPDRRRVAIVAGGRPNIPSKTPIFPDFENRHYGLRIVDLQQRSTSVVGGDVLRGLLRWSRDGRLLTVLRTSEGNRMSWRYASVETNGRTVWLGDPRRGPFEDEMDGRPSVYAGWTGRWPVGIVRAGTAESWVRLRPGRQTPLPFSGTARPVGSADGKVWIRDDATMYEVGDYRTNRIATRVSATRTISLDPTTLGSRSVRNPDHADLVSRDDARGAGVRSVEADGRLGSRFGVRSDRHILAINAELMVTRSVDTHGGESLFLTRRKGNELRIDRINGMLEQVDLPRALHLTSSDAHGAVVHHWLLVPNRAGPLAMIVVPYPGTRFGLEPPREAGISFYDVATNAQLLTSAGYAVLLPDMPLEQGSAHPSAAFDRQVNVALDSAVATGLIDPKRIGVMGHSFGAYAALMLGEQSARFKAIVAANGPTDLLSVHGSMEGADRVRMERGVSFGNAGWAERGQGAIGRRPSEDPGAYLNASPIARMDRIDAPVLLLAGDLDFAGMSQSEHAFMELAREGKDATLARYWGENHTNSSPGNIRAYWQRVIEFLNRHLNGSRASSDATLPRLSEQG